MGGSNTPLIQSGLFFASKERVLDVKVIPFTAPGIQTTIKRVLVIFELEKYCVATTHLDSGNGKNLAQVHKAEIAQAKQELAKCTKPYVLCGDLNEDRQKPTEAYVELTETFVDCLADKKSITCTDKLEKERFNQPGPIVKSSIDYIAYPKGQPMTATAVAFATKGLSDHYWLEGRLHFSDS
jgi:endonuclease/exonuclease/phosphatase family metal-dependent hydrolase